MGRGVGSLSFLFYWPAAVSLGIVGRMSTAAREPTEPSPLKGAVDKIAFEEGDFLALSDGLA
jgi:hypothetical protein